MKNKFFDFYFSSYSYFCSKTCQFSRNFHDNFKNKNRKIYFSFVSAHCASFMKIWTFLRGEGLHILTFDMARFKTKLNQCDGLMDKDKTLGLSAGRSGVRILSRGKCSLKTIAVDASVSYPLYLYKMKIAETHYNL